MLESESQPPSEITVLLTNEEEIRELNRKFLGKNRPTDVLSFPSGGFPRENYLGDISICVPIAAMQAKTKKHSLEYELAFLAVHGGLHLLGYEDETENGYRKMMRKTMKVMRMIGLKNA
ncbi:MAG TPA: rRNA maturation RNase YbeY [Fimbriimonadales bacterium]|nr:rRNA maturation RNase YbeY [Fimbriimonadales bacterium]